MIDESNCVGETELNTNSDNCFVNLKEYNQQLIGKFSFLNEDLNLFGQYNVIKSFDGSFHLNLNVIADSVQQLMHEYRSKVKMLDDINDRLRFSESEVSRTKKLLSRKSHEYETAANDCARIKEKVNEQNAEMKMVQKHLNDERNNIRVLNSNILRERNQYKTDKSKLEKDMTLLRERMTKLLSDPKKTYPSIEFNAAESLPGHTKNRKRLILVNEKYENQVNEELIASYRRQLEDVLLENRQLREQLVSHLVHLKLILRDTDDHLSSNLGTQRNNSGISRNSSDSDISISSNQTFIVSHQESDLDERIYLEMPFAVIKDDLSNLFEKCCTTLSSIREGYCKCQYESKSSKLNISTSAEFCDPVSSENINRLQKEIFKLRRQLIDYETIIQKKDSLLEVAIEQRIRRGSLLSNDSDFPVAAADII